MRTNPKNIQMNEKFNSLDESKKMEVLGITEETFATTRFKGIAREVVINDLWNSHTNAEKRVLLNA